MLRVMVIGAAGKMGREVCRAVLGQEDMSLVGAVDRKDAGQDLGAVLGTEALGLAIVTDLEEELHRAAPDVAIDFTTIQAARKNIPVLISNGVRPVVGTTGFTPDELAKIAAECDRTGRGAVIIPNFSLGAMLLARFARETIRHFPACEVVELHHQQKRDAPSGTALRLVESLSGGSHEIPIHSVRLPGLVAHHEVLFGGSGELLTIRHDSMSRESFIPGILLAVRRAPSLRHLVTSMEALLEIEQ